MSELRIPYTGNRRIFIATILFFGICTAVSLFIALDGNVIARILIFDLSPGSSTVVYIVFAIISLLFVVAGIFLLVNSFKNKAEIVFYEKEISLPGNGRNTIFFNNWNQRNENTIDHDYRGVF